MRGNKMRGFFVAAVAVVISVLTTAPPAAAAELEPWMTPVDPAWLTKVNFFRAWSGLPPVVEDTDLSYGDYLHARYSFMTGDFRHDEDPTSEWYTPAGQIAAASSNLHFGSATPIEGWMAAPFHAIGILRSTLARVGFGSYQSHSGLDVLNGRDHDRPATYPITFPGNGSQVPINGFRGEVPSPTAGCGAPDAPYGTPLIAMFGPGHDHLTSASLVDGAGTPIPLCTWDATTFNDPIADPSWSETGRSILRGDGAVLLIPRTLLNPGQTYTAQATAGDASVTWSFTIGAARLAGGDRYATAAAIAQAGWSAGQAGAAVIASGTAFADALAGGALAAHLDGPLLPTAPCELPPMTAATIQNLRPTQIIVAGGTTAVCEGVVDQLTALGVAPVQRVAGGDRFQTAAAMARTFWPGGASGAVLASGRDFPDGLAGGVAAGAADEPLLLVDQCELPPATAAELTRLGVASTRLLGGSGAVCDAVDAAITATGVGVTRIAGGDRYDTAARVAASISTTGGTTFVANGTSFADGLAIGALAAHQGSPLLLVPGPTPTDWDCEERFWTGAVPALPVSVADALAQRPPLAVAVAGGTGAVCNPMLSALAYTTRPG